jgi:hypothetical protein
MMVSICACGEIRLFIEDQAVGQVVECHCHQCRSFHGAASVHYVYTNSLRIVETTKKIGCRSDHNHDHDNDNNSSSHNNESLEADFSGHCDGLSVSLRRMFCQRCFSRLYSVVTQDDNSVMPTPELLVAAMPSTNEASPSTRSTIYMVNVAAIIDQTITRHLFSLLSQAGYDKLNADLLPYWATAEEEGESTSLHGGDSSSNVNELIRCGGCHCGECRYEFHAAEATEVLHCYCRLCRRHAGSLYMSWVPIQTLVQHFRWTTMRCASLSVTRPTESGRRYFCSKCGTNLAILYDEEATEDEETSWIWVSGGSLDVGNPALVFERRAHIYCRYKPRWYEIPDDDLSQSSD